MANSVFDSKKKGPNLFLLGAPKCGTTSLAHWLSQHPDIFISHPKEPHYFNSDMKNRRIKEFKKYANLFPLHSQSQRYRGEASTWYFFSKNAVPEILNYDRTSKLIVALRNPAEMALSLYHHNKRHGHETASSFEEAWKLQKRRASGCAHVPMMCLDPNFLQYKAACSLHIHLERLLMIAPKNQVCLVWLNDIHNRPLEVMKRIEQFLGLPPIDYYALASLNEAAEVRSRLVLYIVRIAQAVKQKLGVSWNFGFVRLNEKPLTKEKLAGAFQAEIEAEFQEVETNINRLIKEYDFAYPNVF